MASDPLRSAARRIDNVVADNAAAWDLDGTLPIEMLRTLGAEGLLCPQVPVDFGGRGAASLECGEFTAYTGSRCSSLRSIMTSQGMAAWTIQRFGTTEQRGAYLRQLVGGQLAAVGFSEPAAGSDLAAISTEIVPDGDEVVVSGEKRWVTGARYADLVVVFGRYEDAAAAVVIPADTPGLTRHLVPNPLGCRAAGHSHLSLDAVRLPRGAVLGGTSYPISMLTTAALLYGRVSVAWGCVGILRACLRDAAVHADTRQQFGRALVEHQLVARHLAELVVSEQTATRLCEYASRCWDSSAPEMVTAAVVAKHASAGHAAAGASAAVQVLASAGAQDTSAVARAYRDAKLMEIIEGSNEICQLILAQSALERTTTFASVP